MGGHVASIDGNDIVDSVAAVDAADEQPIPIPGVVLRREAEQAISDLDLMPLGDLLSPSKLTEYLTRTVGEYQAVVDVDSHVGTALTTMMRQSLLLVLANQRILGKSNARADELQRLRDELETYLFAGPDSVSHRVGALISTVEPAVREVLEGVLVDADKLVVELVHKHVDAAVDGHELVARRAESEQLKARLSTADALVEHLRSQLADARTSAGAVTADARRAGNRFALLAAGAGLLAGLLSAGAAALYLVW